MSDGPNGYLVGDFNPFEKYESKWESSSNRDEHKTCFKPPPSDIKNTRHSQLGSWCRFKDQARSSVFHSLTELTDPLAKHTNHRSCGRFTCQPPPPGPLWFLVKILRLFSATLPEIKDLTETSLFIEHSNPNSLDIYIYIGVL